MNKFGRYESGVRVARLADLIVRAKPVQIHFQSEEQFLQLVGLPQNVVPVKVDDYRDSRW